MFTTPDGGLTAAGYVLSVAVLLAALGAAAVISSHRKDKKPFATRRLVFCAVAIALAYIASYIKLVHLPFGGSITLFSMLFIVLVGNWYGTAVGLLVGFAYGLLQFLQNPYVLSLLQVCLDYLFAFAALGLSGVFCNKKHGLIKGYILGVAARGFFSSLAGYAFWMEYMPENFPKSISMLYPVVYNFGFMAAEGIVTVIVIMIPAVSRALDTVKKLAQG